MKIFCVILYCLLFSSPEPVASATEEGTLIMAHIVSVFNYIGGE